MSEPKWLTIARRYLGEQEIAGPRSNPVIAGFYHAVNGSNLADEVPWCAAYVGACLGKAGLPDTDSFMARSYLRYGQAIDTPRLGCVVVFWRGKPNASTGHVAFFLRRVGNKIEVLGGNQGDRVSIARYPASRLLGYRWPPGADMPATESVLPAHSLRVVQEQLKRLGYHEAGRVDGFWGTRTRAGVLAFRADNDLPLKPNATDPDFIHALFVVGNPRAIAPERATADLADLRDEESRIVAAGDAVNVVGAGGLGVGGLGAIATVVGQAGEAVDQVSYAVTPFRSLLAALGEYWWIWIGLLGIGALLMWLGLKILRARRDDKRTGKTA